MTTSILPMVFSSSWASGINAYLVVLVLGLAEKFGHFSQIPDFFSRTDVLIGAGVLFAIEFVADKIPYLDSTWDAISTVLRPAVGAAVAYLFAQDHATGEQIAYAALGGVTAFASHSVKSGSRLAINTSPEPVTNVAASIGEDLTVAGVMALALNHPWIALGVSGTLLVVGLVVLFLILRRVRHGWRKWKRIEPRTAA